MFLSLATKIVDKRFSLEFPLFSRNFNSVEVSRKMKKIQKKIFIVLLRKNIRNNNYHESFSSKSFEQLFPSFTNFSNYIKLSFMSFLTHFFELLWFWIIFIANSTQQILFKNEKINVEKFWADEKKRRKSKNNFR